MRPESGSEGDFQQDRIVVGTGKAEVQSLNTAEIQVVRDNEAVNTVILRVDRICRIVGLVQQPAARNVQVVDIAEALRQSRTVQQTGTPELGMGVGIPVQTAREALVKVASGNHVVALPVLFFQKSYELTGLFELSLSFVIGLEMEIDKDQLLLAPQNGVAGDEQTAFEIGRGERPGERTGRAMRSALVTA